MTKNPCFIFLFIFILLLESFSQTASNEVSNETALFSTILENSIPYKQFKINKELQLLQYKLSQKSWLPLPYLYLEPQFSNQGSNQNFISLQTTTGISQKLPLLSSLSLQITQPFSVDLADSSLSYGFTTSGSISSSIAVFIPNLAGEYWKQEKTFENNSLLELEKKYEITEKSLENELYVNISNYLYYKEIASIYKTRNSILEEKNKEDLELYLLGQITSIELSEREKQRTQVFSSYMDSISQMFRYENELETQDICVQDLSFSYEEWLLFLENVTRNYDITKQSSKDLQLLQKKLEWKTVLENQISKLPTVSSKYMIQPISSGGTNPKLFWNNVTSLNWNISIGMKIPFVPWDPSFSVKPNLTLQQKEFQLAQYQIEKDKNKEIGIREKKLENLKFLSQENKEQYELELERQNLYRELYNSGRMSKITVRIQESMTEETLVKWNYSKQKIIEAILSFY